MNASRTATLTLPTDEQILVEREFDAPKHLVYRAFTEPDLVRRWWTANRGDMTAAEIDLRVGGTYRFAMVTPDGMEVAFRGEYHEIVPDERIVSTEVYEGAPGSEGTRNTLTLDESDGRTTVTILIDAGSKETRDAILASGMEDGLQDALDLLDEVARSLA